MRSSLVEDGRIGAARYGGAALSLFAIVACSCERRVGEDVSTSPAMGTRPGEATVHTRSQALGTLVAREDGALSLHFLDTGERIEAPWPALRRRPVRELAVDPSGRVVVAVDNVDRKYNLLWYDIRNNNLRIVWRSETLLAGPCWTDADRFLCVSCQNEKMSILAVTVDSTQTLLECEYPDGGAAPPSKHVLCTRDVAAVRGGGGMWVYRKNHWRWKHTPDVVIGKATGEMIYLLRLGRLYQVDSHFLNEVEIPTPKRGYAFYHGFVVRSDGERILYSYPSTFGGGEKWVILNPREGTHLTRSAAVPVTKVLAWTPAELVAPSTSLP